MFPLVPTPHNPAIWDQISSRDFQQGVICMGQSAKKILRKNNQLLTETVSLFSAFALAQQPWEKNR